MQLNLKITIYGWILWKVALRRMKPTRQVCQPVGTQCDRDKTNNLIKFSKDEFQVTCYVDVIVL